MEGTRSQVPARARRREEDADGREVKHLFLLSICVTTVSAVMFLQGTPRAVYETAALQNAAHSKVTVPAKGERGAVSIRRDIIARF